MIGLENSSLVRVVRLTAASAMLVGVAACGGAAESRAPGVKSPDVSESSVTGEPTSIKEAQQRIAAAKAELAGGPSDAAKAGSFAAPQKLTRRSRRFRARARSRPVCA